MRAAVIYQGVVENVIEAPLDFNPGRERVMVETSVAGPGWTYAGGVFLGPRRPVPVPATVTAYQLREALRMTPNPIAEGTLLNAVEAYVVAHASDNPRLYTAWNWVDPWRRDSIITVVLVREFGMTPISVGVLFGLAAMIEQ